MRRVAATAVFLAGIAVSVLLTVWGVHLTSAERRHHQAEVVILAVLDGFMMGGAVIAGNLYDVKERR